MENKEITEYVEQNGAPNSPEIRVVIVSLPFTALRQVSSILEITKSSEQSLFYRRIAPEHY
jgi:hypothetical protein